MAGLQPPHLTAMVPWEGAADSYRDVTHHGGILCQFIARWYPRQVESVQYGVGERARKNPNTDESVAGPVTLDVIDGAALNLPATGDTTVLEWRCLPASNLHIWDEYPAIDAVSAEIHAADVEAYAKSVCVRAVSADAQVYDFNHIGFAVEAVRLAFESRTHTIGVALPCDVTTGEP